MAVKLYAALTITEEDLDGIRVGNEISSHRLIEEAKSAQIRGADALLIVDAAPVPLHEESIHLLRAVCEAVCVPVTVSGPVKRLEDVKKYLYAGCSCVVLHTGDPVQYGLLREASERFGKEKTAAAADCSVLSENADFLDSVRSFAGSVFTLMRPEEYGDLFEGLPVIFFEREKSPAEGLPYFLKPDLSGYCHEVFTDLPDYPIAEFKAWCLKEGAKMHVLESSLTWDDFKTGEDGLLPVIVQDFENDEVLMMAWMDRSGFEETLRTGKMVYFSRSRQDRWCKGETSGHYQYVRSLSIDCDRDTMLAKVIQSGAACHTGNRSCFYTSLADSGITKQNPQQVLEDVYETILDRKNHPKEGSYTNYLFEKGIDKILKKLGEENAETIIAAKNPGSEEIVYEISDYLYHLMVLMAEKGVRWEEIAQELARRH
ncbi:MAG: bifunctional phosphoribosyl-AMP cyclohydrolase/phosphoribosyl-ATP diphosphatase HisIE [Lachnospiraceae bacterium]|nr:bifunctional phosphoribosyl-AMP cyclohydrolase/phosphoribosyl-ATP diphosphatase HisIE [Lachnospiraceae bacterium]